MSKRGATSSAGKPAKARSRFMSRKYRIVQLGGSFTPYTLTKASASFAINVTLQNQMNKAGSGPTMASVISGYERTISGSKVLAIFKNQYSSNTLVAGDFVAKNTTAVVPGKMTLMRTPCMYTLIVSGTTSQVSSTTLRKLTASATAPKFVTTGTTQRAVFTSVALNAKITTTTMRAAGGTGSGGATPYVSGVTPTLAINVTLQAQMNKAGSGPKLLDVINGYEKQIAGSQVIGIYRNQYTSNKLVATEFVPRNTTSPVSGAMTTLRSPSRYTLIVSGSTTQVSATTLRKLTASATAPKFTTTGTTKKPVFYAVALNTKITADTMKAGMSSGTGTTPAAGTTPRASTTPASTTANAALNNIAELARPPPLEEFIRMVANSKNQYKEITDAQKDAYNPLVSNDITPKTQLIGNGTFVYDYFPVSSISNPNAEVIYMVASPLYDNKDPTQTVVAILKKNKSLFSPGSTGVTADMPGPQVASEIDKVVGQSLIQPQALLLAAQKIFTNLPPPFLAKFAPVTADAKTAVTAVSNAKTKYDALIKTFMSTPGRIT